MNPQIMRLGLDLAKSAFVIHGVDGKEQCRLQWALRRAEVLRFLSYR